MKALIEHVAAFSSKDNRRFAEVVSLPFVHLWQDGEIWRYDDRDDVDLLKQYARAGIDAENFGCTELDEARLILDWDDLKAFYVTFTRYTADGGKAGRAEAMWVVVRDGGSWKLKLRIGARRIK
ncbi:MAG: hypothetical protein HYS46_03320 [Betaproteobacteria bacterium]|nr:hypothetical protein [Betaproteobacteria bacterium]